MGMMTEYYHYIFTTLVSAAVLCQLFCIDNICIELRATSSNRILVIVFVLCEFFIYWYTRSSPNKRLERAQWKSVSAGT